MRASKTDVAASVNNISNSGSKAKDNDAKQGSKKGGPRIRKLVPDQAYWDSVQNLLPMSPEQIRSYRNRIRRTRRALHRSKPSKLKTGTKVLRLGPGAKPITIYVSPGYASAISILDKTGQPWPIKSSVVGDGSSFNAVRPDIKGKNLIVVTAKGRHRDSNLMLSLKNWPTPVMMHLKTAPTKATGNLVLRTDHSGPNAKPQIINTSHDEAISNTMLAFLNGVPPDDAVPLRVEGADGKPIQAWYFKKKLYLRMHQAARWPAWKNSAQGPGGVRVYVMPKVTQAAIYSGGTTQTIRLTKVSMNARGNP